MPYQKKKTNKQTKTKTYKKKKKKDTQKKQHKNESITLWIVLGLIVFLNF